MLTDWSLAIAHHLLAFGLLAVLAYQWGRLASPLDAADIGTLSKVDAVTV